MNTNTQNPIRIAVATAALFAALTAAAHAGDVPQIHVRYTNLDVNTTAGATALYRRIRGAADQVCNVGATRDLGRAAEATTCAARAISEAVATVNAPALTAVYEAKMGGAAAVQLATAR